MTSPSSDLIRQAVARLDKQSGSTEFVRVEAFFRSILTGHRGSTDTRQNPRVGFFPGLSAQPFHDPCTYAPLRRISKLLEGNFEAIRFEYLNVSGGYGDIFCRCQASNRYADLFDDDWGTFVIWRQGEVTPAAAMFFPETCSLVRQILSDLSPFDEVCFLRLKPGVRLPPHTDGTNLTLTCHLGVSIPFECGLRVDGETRKWEEGRCLWFDHSFVHEAWNDSAEPRVILLLDVLHPEITVPERGILRDLSRALIAGARTGAGSRA